ncbi:CHAT domain-containing protein [Microseira sp. BLCC-F43]|uniref:CHAT domain-containing protein n=1 Tax=Microseira sp. BLCC-F43 TaxID=3153602 RepID=UPI0035B86853
MATGAAMKSVASSVSMLLAALYLAGSISGKAVGILPKDQAVVLPEAVHSAPLETPQEQPNLSSMVPQIEQTWEKQFEDYFRRSFPERSITVKDIADTLNRLAIQTKTKPALLYVVPLQQQLELVLITPGNPPIHKRVAAANRKALLAQAREFSLTVSAATLEDASNYLPPAQQLYQWMIAPVERDLQAQGIDTLIFCMGVGLRTLPLAALHDGQKFLIEKYSITRIPAFKLTDTIYTDLKNSPVLAMGASVFKEQNPLPAVPVELSAIAQTIWHGRFFLNQEFTEDNLRIQRQQQPFKIIHLATHADFLPGKPRDSYIQFWDNKLTLDKIGQLGLNNPPVELLVLSACKTAIGNEEAELGFAGLAVQAGVKSAVASLWYVSDEGTLALMTEFYRHLQTAPIKAAALQKAQIEMITGQLPIENGQLQSHNGRISLPPALAKNQNQNLSHPYYWAAFTVVGSPW